MRKHEKRHSFSQLFLCLSRACLGKKIDVSDFSIKWRGFFLWTGTISGQFMGPFFFYFLQDCFPHGYGALCSRSTCLDKDRQAANRFIHSHTLILTLTRILTLTLTLTLTHLLMMHACVQ